MGNTIASDYHDIGCACTLCSAKPVELRAWESQGEPLFQPGDISERALSKLVRTDCTDCGLRAGFSPHADQCVSEAAEVLGQGAFKALGEG